jgi:hypothetical protein
MEKKKTSLIPGLPPTIGWLVDFDEPHQTKDGSLSEDGMQTRQHVVLEEPQGHYADCALPLISAMEAHDLGFLGWIPIAEELPRIMSGYIALLHPDYDEPTVSYVGTHPKDFREDGYTHFMPLARIPHEHVLRRRKAKFKPQARQA